MYTFCNIMLSVWIWGVPPKKNVQSTSTLLVWRKNWMIWGTPIWKASFLIPIWTPSDFTTSPDTGASSAKPSWVPSARSHHQAKMFESNSYLRWNNSVEKMGIETQFSMCKRWNHDVWNHHGRLMMFFHQISLIFQATKLGFASKK